MAALSIETARAWVKRNRVLAGFIAALAAFLILSTWMTAAFASRASARFTELAREANEAGDYDRGITLGLAALNGHDAPLIGFDGDAAHTELMRAIVQSRRISSFTGGDARDINYDNAEFSPDGSLIIAQATFFYGSDDPILYGADVWSVSTGERVHRIQWEDGLGHVNGAAISPDNTLALTSDADARVRLWTLTDGALQKQFPNPLEGLTVNAAFAPDGASAAVADYAGIYIWTFATDEVRTLTTARHCGAPSYSADGALITALCNDGTGRVWDAASGAVRQTLRVSGDYLHDDSGAVFSPDGERLALATQEEVSIWDWRRGRRLATLAGAGGMTNDRQIAVGFSPDGARLLATAWESNTEARIWDIAAQRERAVLQWFSIAVGPQASASPSANRAVTTGGQELVHLWDTATEPDPDRPVLIARGRSAPLSSLNAGALRRYACAQHLTDGVSVPHYNEIDSIDPSLAADVCASNFWGRMLAAFGGRARPRAEEQTVSLPSGRIVFRSSGEYQSDRLITLWIEDGGARYARRDVVRGRRYDAYWDGSRLHWRTDDQPAISSMSFEPPRHMILGVFGFVPGVTLRVDGRAHSLMNYSAPPGAAQQRRIAGVEVDCIGENRCRWNNVLVYDVTENTRFEATEIEENAPIPDELRALADH